MTTAALPAPASPSEPGATLSGRARYVLAVFGAWALWPLFWMSESLTMTGTVSHTDTGALYFRDAVVWSLVTLGIFALARRFPLERGRWLVSLPAHLGGAAAVALASGTVTWVFEDRGRLGYLASLSRGWEMDVSWYVYVLGIGLALHHRREARERERAAAALATAAAELESEVARARWDAARLRMHPAFVDAALEAVATLAPTDPARADALTVRLADLLRLTVDHFGAEEVPLEEELGFLDAYLAVQRLRLRAPLAVSVDADAEAQRAPVPAFLLPPLADALLGSAFGGAPEVRVAARRERGALRLDLSLDGGTRGAEDEAAARLAEVAPWLRRLYGAGATVEAAANGGPPALRVRLPERAANGAGPGVTGGGR